MSEKVLLTQYESEIEVEPCPQCHGTGNSFDWDRKLQKHVEDNRFCCERCKGARFIVVSHWKKGE